MSTEAKPEKAERVDLVLRELESLPTLSSVAVRLLEVTADEGAVASEVIELVASDPALASKVLSLCRCHDRGRASQVTSIDRAVLLLGFEAVRAAALSVNVFEVLDRIRTSAGELPVETPVFDREAFWLHAIAVALTSERIAAQGTLAKSVRPSDAFVAGLLHDLGQLALHVVLPESFEQVCRVAETHGTSLDHACRRIIGLDTHTAGKRLAEHWKLPRSLVDVIWLCGQPHEALPAVPHRPLISVVTLADAIVRNRYITPGAHWGSDDGLRALCVPVGLPVDRLANVLDGLHDEVTRRAGALGIGDLRDSAILLRSIWRANRSLARANAGLRQRESVARRQGRQLDALLGFHRALPPQASVADVIEAIAISCGDVFDARPVAILDVSPEDGDWRVKRLTPTGRPYGARSLTPPAEGLTLDELMPDLTHPTPALAAAPWLALDLDEDLDLAALHLLALAPGGPGRSVLVLPAGATLDLDDRALVLGAWGAALDATAEREGGARLAERLATANRALVDAQDALARSRTLRALGEVAAGAAHEMNNPLTIISGRGQLLAARLQNPEQNAMAREIVEQAHGLSNMITALRTFAEPLRPVMCPVDLIDLVVREVQKYETRGSIQPQINTVLTSNIPLVRVDPDLLSDALGELVKNAVESKGCAHIELRVQTLPLDDRLKIEVRDDGEGLSEHALQHAFDPFFSERPAGRQPGLGLARARRFVEAHGGEITLVNGSSGGAVATIWLRDWRQQDTDTPEAAGKTEDRAHDRPAGQGIHR